MSIFQFKYFSVFQENSSMKVGTDSMILGALVESVNPSQILDVGSGTGVLSLMMAQKFPEAKITGVELDLNAVRDCALNFRNSQWSDRLYLVQSNFLEFETEVKFDLIISNPPFFERSLKNKEESKTKARHTDSLPLEDLIREVSRLMTLDGAFWVVLPADNAFKLMQLAESFDLFPARIIEIEGKPGSLIRNVIEFKGQRDIAFRKEVVCVRDGKGDYTSRYKELTAEFHNKQL